MTPPEAFARQSQACAELGSPFTARLMRLAGEALAPGGAVADRILGWPGDAGPGGDSVPLRLAGALHALVLSGRDDRLEAVYADPAAFDDGALWEAIAGAVGRHEAEILGWLDSPPQTNEVRRSAVLIAAGHWLAARFGLPLVLSELGASAGLNLIWDRYALDLPGASLGPSDAVLRLAPDWDGAAPPACPPRVADRAGVDLNPLDPVRDRLRVLSYIWADQPDRLARTRAALDEAARLCPRIDRGDAAGWLAARLGRPMPQRLHLVFHTVAWQYFPPATQAECTRALAEAGARATLDAPLAHLGMEADARPGSAAVTLTLWPGGESVVLGRADFHGRRVDWRAPALDGCAR